MFVCCKLKKKKLTISFAESCTGGLLAQSITSISGASKVFNISVVTYSNDSKSLILKVPKKIIIIVDAAYSEYVTDKDYSNGIDFAKRHKNIIVTRTFSKIFGLASLRLGWCYAHNDIR